MFGGHRGFDREVSKPSEVRKTLRRLWGYFSPFKGLLLGTGLLILFTAVLRLAGPYIISVAIDQFIAGEDKPVPGWLMWLLSIFSATPHQIERSVGLNVAMVSALGIYLLNWIASGAQMYLMALVGQRVLLNMRTQIFERIQTLSLSFFDQHEAGDLMSRLVNDTEVINRVFTFGVVRLASMSLALIGIPISMLALNWQLAVASFGVLPIMFAATTFFARRARAAFRRTRKTIGQVSTELQENISGVREVQAFAREQANVASFQALNAANRDANIQAQSIMSAFTPTLDILSYVALAIVIGFGGYLTLAFDPPLISVGVIIAFVMYVRRFYQPVRMIASLYAQVQSAVAGAERIFELLDTQPEVTDAADAIQLPTIEGKIEIDGVSFAYQEDEPVLQDVSITAQPGETIALVGPTGVGKTTIVSLLTRFYDVDQGAIRIDGRDVREVTRASLRRQMGIVLQDTFLFSGTVMDNVRYGRLDATNEEVIAAAKLANAGQFIDRLPDGYQTELGERGHTLSQGQRQLIAIARAILADPRILILDEATSNVDTRTEQLIQKALDKLLAGRTSFVIAHRLSTIRDADQVIVMEEGRVIERGTHTELLESGGLYAELYNSQFRRQTTPAA